MVKWTDGTATWEPLSVISKDDPVTIAKYASQAGLIHTTGWKCFSRLVKSDERIR